MTSRDEMDIYQMHKRVEALEEGLRDERFRLSSLLDYLNLEDIRIPDHVVELSYKILPIDNGKETKR